MLISRIFCRSIRLLLIIYVLLYSHLNFDAYESQNIASNSKQHQQQ